MVKIEIKGINLLPTAFDLYIHSDEMWVKIGKEFIPEQNIGDPNDHPWHGKVFMYGRKFSFWDGNKVDLSEVAYLGERQPTGVWWLVRYFANPVSLHRAHQKQMVDVTMLIQHQYDNEPLLAGIVGMPFTHNPMWEFSANRKDTPYTEQRRQLEKAVRSALRGSPGVLNDIGLDTLVDGVSTYKLEESPEMKLLDKNPEPTPDRVGVDIDNMFITGDNAEGERAMAVMHYKSKGYTRNEEDGLWYPPEQDCYA